jgi:hypothetical protein
MLAGRQYLLASGQRHYVSVTRCQRYSDRFEGPDEASAATSVRISNYGIINM